MQQQSTVSVCFDFCPGSTGHARAQAAQTWVRSLSCKAVIHAPCSTFLVLGVAVGRPEHTDSRQQTRFEIYMRRKYCQAQNMQDVVVTHLIIRVALSPEIIRWQGLRKTMESNLAAGSFIGVSLSMWVSHYCSLQLELTKHNKQGFLSHHKSPIFFYFVSKEDIFWITSWGWVLMAVTLLWHKTRC